MLQTGSPTAAPSGIVYAQAKPLQPSTQGVQIVVQSTGVTGPPPVQPLSAAYPAVQPLSAVASPSTPVASSEAVVAYATAVPVQVVASAAQQEEQADLTAKAAYAKKLAQEFVEKQHEEGAKRAKERHAQRLRDEALLVNEAEEVSCPCTCTYRICVCVCIRVYIHTYCSMCPEVVMTH